MSKQRQDAKRIDDLEDRLKRNREQAQQLHRSSSKIAVELAGMTTTEDRERVAAHIVMMPERPVVIVPHGACQSENMIEDIGLMQALANGEEIAARCLKCGKPLTIYKPLVVESNLKLVSP